MIFTAHHSERLAGRLGTIGTSVQHAGAQFLDMVNYVGGMGLLGWKAARALVGERFPGREILKQCEILGVRSLSLTNLVLIFTGMVLALQFTVGLSRFGLKLYSGQVIGIAIVRELGPVLTAIMIAARVGSGIAAELGSMVVTEQVMAVAAMGANPYRTLVLPRLFVTTLVTPVLTMIANVTGILGGMVITVAESGVGWRFFLDQVLTTVTIGDFSSGVGKSFFFGLIIGLVACYQGLTTSYEGTRGVGRSTTSAVVIASILVFIADYFLTKLFLVL